MTAPFDRRMFSTPTPAQAPAEPWTDAQIEAAARAHLERRLPGLARAAGPALWNELPEGLRAREITAMRAAYEAASALRDAPNPDLEAVNGRLA